MGIIDSKNNLPLYNQRFSSQIEGFIFDTAESELVGHKITSEKGLVVSSFYMLYRTPGGRYYTYNQKRDPGSDPLLQGPEINLKPISKKEAETMYPELSDPRMSFNEAFNQIVDA